MILVDTSVWVHVLRVKSGKTVQAFRKKTASEIVVFSHFIQLELLQGAKDEFEWKRRSCCCTETMISKELPR